MLDSFYTHFDEINIKQERQIKLYIKTPVAACLDSLLLLNTYVSHPKWFDASFNLLDTGKSLQYVVNYPQYIYLQSGGFCRYWDTIEMQVKTCQTIDYNLFFPSAFTPNKDGQNEVFNPQEKDWNRISMEIYNQWGELIYKTEKADEGWDGTFKNDAVQQGNYLVKITLKAKGNRSETNPFTYWKGMINVLR